MSKPKKSFSYVIQVALSALKDGPNADGVAWLRKEFNDWLSQCFDLECITKEN